MQDATPPKKAGRPLKKPKPSGALPCILHPTPDFKAVVAFQLFNTYLTEVSHIYHTTVGSKRITADFSVSSVKARLCPNATKCAKNCPPNRRQAGVLRHRQIAEYITEGRLPTGQDRALSNWVNFLDKAQTVLLAHLLILPFVQGTRNIFTCETPFVFKVQHLFIGFQCDLTSWVLDLDGKHVLTNDRPTIKIFDWKSGNINKKMVTDVNTKRYDNKLGADCIQLMCYAFLYERFLGVTVASCHLVYAGTGNFHEHAVQREDDSVVLQWLVQTR